MEIQFHRNGPLAPWRGEVSLLGTIPWRVAFCKSNAKQKTSSQAYARSLVPKEAAQLAIFHLSAKIISRGKGQSAIASAAYRSGDKLHDERYDETQDYTTKGSLSIQKSNSQRMPQPSIKTEKLFGTA